MFCATPLYALLTLLSLLSSPLTVSAALQNVTIDDQDFSKIIYTSPGDWDHDPLIGWEYQFNDGSRSYSWVPGASASLTFTGSGIYLQGPPAPDQAQRRVFLDGRDMGAFNHRASEREYCSVFFSATQLPYTTHTIVVSHNDTRDTIFAMDAWFVEFDDAQSILPYTTTTTTQTGATHTITTYPTDSNGNPIPNFNGTVAGSPNTPDVNAAAPTSYAAIIIGIVVPIALLLALCIVGFCIYRSRRARSAQRRRESFREKFWRRGNIQLNTPFTQAFGKQAEGTGLVTTSPRLSPGIGDAATGTGMGSGTDSIASTRYSTALEHGYHSDHDPVSPNSATAMMSTTSPRTEMPTISPPGNIVDPRILSAAINTDRNKSSTSLTVAPIPRLGASAITSTFDPPAEWMTKLSSPSPSAPGPDQPHSHPVTHSSEAHTHAHKDTLTAIGGLAALAGASARVARTSPSRADAPGGSSSNPDPGRRAQPSTVSSPTESAYSFVGPTARYQNLQPQPPPPPQTPDSPTSNGGGGGGGGATRPNSVLRRFSTAITSNLPFTRVVGSRPNSRHSNSHAMINTNTGAQNNGHHNDGYGGPNGSLVAANTTQNDDLESNGEGYFHGVNHFNLGIPLNYRPTATESPTTLYHPNLQSPTALFSPPPPASSPATTQRLGRHSQDLNDRYLGFEDVWLGSRGGSNSGEPHNLFPTTPGGPSGGSPFDDFAFSSYTSQARARVLSYPTAATGDNTGDNGTGDAVPPAPLPPSLGTREAGGDGEGGDETEPEEKDEKIRETLDGETMHGDDEGESRWSVDHGTLASQGVAADGVTRTGSLGRQRSVGSNADHGRQQVMPPPYSVYVPPDTKTSPSGS